jgi:hypothetical protein
MRGPIRASAADVPLTPKREGGGRDQNSGQSFNDFTIRRDEHADASDSDLEKGRNFLRGLFAISVLWLDYAIFKRR